MSGKCVLLLLCYHLLLGGTVSEFTPTVYPAKILPSSQCSLSNSLHHEKLRETLRKIKQNFQIPILPTHSNYTSCKAIHDDYPSAPDYYYNITTANGSTKKVFCDMKGTNCAREGGWMRVAYINMTEPGATCPQGLNQTSYNNKSLCGNFKYGCNSTIFPTLVEYSKVCGQVRGYQYGLLLAFYPHKRNPNLTIDDAYVDGVSITYGNNPRKHIWTYAGGLEDTTQYYGSYDCPCKQNSTTVTPPYVGTDYYCESGVHLCCPVPHFYNDPLWDGQQCGGGEAPCCTHPNMPWFIKILNETTTEDIELRVCDFTTFDDTPLELIELFVK